MYVRFGHFLCEIYEQLLACMINCSLMMNAGPKGH